jgi:hypothetical protein
MIVVWAIGPLLFFMAEYMWIGLRGDNDLPNVEAFKYGQELAAKFWGAALLLLVFLYSGKIPGGGTE